MYDGSQLAALQLSPSPPDSVTMGIFIVVSLTFKIAALCLSPWLQQLVHAVSLPDSWSTVGRFATLSCNALDLSWFGSEPNWDFVHKIDLLPTNTPYP